MLDWLWSGYLEGFPDNRSQTAVSGLSTDIGSSPTVPFKRWDGTEALAATLDHHAAVAERIVEFDAVISSLVAATLARFNVQQNTDLRKIAAWASLAAFVTAFAGIYGMNFQDMPELWWWYGYLLWWIIAVTGPVSLFTALFRRKRWL